MANMSPLQINKAVEAVAKGEYWAARKIISRLLDDAIRRAQRVAYPTSARSRLEDMTSRQLEVGRLVARGARNKEIAQTLTITEPTVKAHLTAIFRKLHVSDLTQLAVIVARQDSP